MPKLLFTFIFIFVFNNSLYADTGIFEATRNGNIARINQLLSKSTNINERNKHQWTPLFEAISWGKIEAAKLLILKNASVTIVNDEGNTPLHMAAFLGHLELVKLLLEKNSQINKKNNDGQTPLHLAASGQVEIVKLLLKKGAKQEKDKYGNSVLDLAGSKKIKDLLLGKCSTCKPEKKVTYRKATIEKTALEDAMYTSEVGSSNSLNDKIIFLKKDYGYSSINGWSGESDLETVTLKMKNVTDKVIFSIDVFVAYYDNQDTIIDVTRKTVYNIDANSEFEVDSKPSSFSRKAKTAFIIFVLVNPKPKD